jgi:chaperonin GroES
MSTPTCRSLPGYEKVKVLGARIVILPVPIEEATASGLIIVQDHKEPKYEGTVVVSGPGARLETGVQMPMELDPGMKIIYSRMAGVPLTFDINGEQQELLVMNERDVIAIIE